MTKAPKLGNNGGISWFLVQFVNFIHLVELDLLLRLYYTHLFNADR